MNTTAATQQAANVILRNIKPQIRNYWFDAAPDGNAEPVTLLMQAVPTLVPRIVIATQR
jgi:hypothetical protein